MRKTFIIAEAGVNHNGSVELALKMIAAAADAGVDAVKFQTFKTNSLVSGHAAKANYQIVNTGTSESQQQMLARLELSLEDHRKLSDYCQSCGIAFLSTPFDDESLRLLVDNLGLPILKVSSGDATNYPFLVRMAQTHRKIILSTGMMTLGEVENALAALAYGYCSSNDPSDWAEIRRAYYSAQGQAALRDQVTLLHCTTDYPTRPEDVHLAKMQTLANAFGLPTGYSDHTLGVEVPIAAVAMGACTIEKHFTLDRNMEGPDHIASLEPAELSAMVSGIRTVELALGSPLKIPTESEMINASAARKSIVASREIPAGEILSAENITIKRPGTGLPPERWWSVLGTAATRAYAKDELIQC